MPKVANARRKAKCKLSLQRFCETYLASRFPLAWSADHVKVIECLQVATIEGGRFAVAMPRGSGKTSLAEAAAIWATLYAHRSFLVLIGSTESAAEEMLDSIKTELESNELLLADFPEVCYPIARLEGISHRANGQTLNGERTRIGWTQKELVYPTVKGKPTSGCVVRVAGITGRIRGMKSTTADGRSIRPDLVIVDDPQTDESAKSPAQNAERERVLAGAILGLAGPRKKISAVMPITVIYPGDMADRILDRDRHPEWNGERCSMVYEFPTNTALWEQYEQLRRDGMRAGDKGVSATEFYRANREAMDAGSRVAWAERYDPDEISAIQHAMNRRIDNPRAFAAECQNRPLPVNEVSASELTPDEVSNRLTRLARGMASRESTKLTIGVDVGQKLLWYSVCAWDDRYSGSVVDYGCFPRQNRPYFAADDARPTLADLYPALAEEARIYAAVTAILNELASRSWPREGGGEMRPDRILVDAGWQTDSVVKAISQSPFAAITLPSKGYAVGASGRPMSEWQRKPGEQIGWNWRIAPNTGSGRGRLALFDPNQWKTFLADRLRTPPGSSGCIQLFGTSATEHQMFADHLTAEYPVVTTGRGRTLNEWKVRPDRSDNHWLDSTILATVAASIVGVAWDSSAAAVGQAPIADNGRPVKLSDIQAKKRELQG